MDEILLYLSLKYDGEWMAIYDSLQKKEELNVGQIKKATAEVSASWITLISSDYPKNLKQIYKPPFGVLCYGKDRLLHKDCVTVYGKLDDLNKEYIKELKANDVGTIWVDKSNKEMKSIMNEFPSGNIFTLPELKDRAESIDAMIMDNVQKDVRNTGNAWVSEIWKRNPEIDYHTQKDERINLGLSLKTLIVSELKGKELKAVSDYCQVEDIKVGIVKEAYTPKMANAFKNNKVFILEEPRQMRKVFGIEEKNKGMEMAA